MDAVIATLVAAFIGAIGGIIGNVIGTNHGAALAGEAARRQHEMERHEHEQAQKERLNSVRTMVSLEIDQNLEALRNFWHENVAALREGTYEERQFLQRRGLTEKVLPTWAHVRWESLPTELGMAFTPSELRDVQTFHSRLDALSIRRALLIQMTSPKLGRDYDTFRKANPVTKVTITDTDYYGQVIRYLHETGEVWAECETLFQELESRDNPVETREGSA